MFELLMLTAGLGGGYAAAMAYWGFRFGVLGL